MSTTPARCEFSWMLKDGCAHCLGIKCEKGEEVEECA